MGAEICRTKAEEGKKEMANETVFTEKAAEYARSRPAYAPQAVEKVLELAGSTENRIGDMGSGTGILSGVFLSRGYEVFCVEPNAAMRARAEATYGQNPPLSFRAGFGGAYGAAGRKPFADHGGLLFSLAGYGTVSFRMLPPDEARRDRMHPGQCPAV